MDERWLMIFGISNELSLAFCGGMGLCEFGEESLFLQRGHDPVNYPHRCLCSHAGPAVYGKS